MASATTEVTFAREVRVVLIPDGETVPVAEGVPEGLTGVPVRDGTCGDGVGRALRCARMRETAGP